MDHSSLIIFNSTTIKFWMDSWCGVHLAHVFNISTCKIDFITFKMNYFLSNYAWFLPQNLLLAYPNMLHKVNSWMLPLNKLSHVVPWNKFHTNHIIPPYKSLLVWRIFNCKVTSDDILAFKGLHFPSTCSLCHKDVESMQHMLFNYEFAKVFGNELLNH